MKNEIAFFAQREIGLALSAHPGFICVDSSLAGSPGCERFVWLNPFHVFPERCIPVPGTNEKARSVESVWQGLKLVDGKTDFAMFGEQPEKRPPDAQRIKGLYDYSQSTFLFGEKEIELVPARFHIYVPAYLFLLERLVPDPVFEELVSGIRSGRKIVFFDWDSSGDIFNEKESFSHSSLLAAYFNGTLEEFFFYRKTFPGPDPEKYAAALPLARYRNLQNRIRG